MKKALFGTSAIAGAAALAAGSAFAGEAPQVTFSGAVAYELQFADGGREDAGQGFRIGGNEQQSEFVWDARGTADNGLEYGANVQWRWMRGDRGFDESYIDVRGSFGRIYLGGEDTVTDLIAGTSGHSVQVGSWGTDGNNALRNVNFVLTDSVFHYYNSAAGMTGDANKIGYITPNFGGFQAGISFTPDGGDQQQITGGDNASQSMVTDIAAGWGGDLGGVGLKVDAGYQFGSDEATNPDVEEEDISSYQIGASVSFAGFGLAAGYLDNGDSGCNKATAGCDDGSGWNVGASYNFGAGSISTMYQNTEQNRNGFDNSEDRAEIWHLGSSFTIAEGMSAYANYYYMDTEQAIAQNQLTVANQAATVGNHAHVLLIGTRVTF